MKVKFKNKWFMFGSLAVIASPGLFIVSGGNPSSQPVIESSEKVSSNSSTLVETTFSSESLLPGKGPYPLDPEGRIIGPSTGSGGSRYVLNDRGQIIGIIYDVPRSWY